MNCPDGRTHIIPQGSQSKRSGTTARVAITTLRYYPTLPLRGEEEVVHMPGCVCDQVIAVARFLGHLADLHAVLTLDARSAPGKFPRDCAAICGYRCTMASSTHPIVSCLTTLLLVKIFNVRPSIALPSALGAVPHLSLGPLLLLILVPIPAAIIGTS